MQEVALYVYKHDDVVQLERKISDLEIALQQSRADNVRLVMDLNRYHDALDEIKAMTKLLKSAGIDYRPLAFQ